MPLTRPNTGVAVLFTTLPDLLADMSFELKCFERRASLGLLWQFSFSMPNCSSQCNLLLLTLQKVNHQFSMYMYMIVNLQGVWFFNTSAVPCNMIFLYITPSMFKCDCKQLRCSMNNFVFLNQGFLGILKILVLTVCSVFHENRLQS